MESDPTELFESWKKRMESFWRDLPKAFRSDHSVRRSLQCHLFGLMQETGYIVIADYMPPRVLDRPIDLIAVTDKLGIVYAVCLDSLVTLPAVKSLSSFPSEHKLIYTMGMLEKKVQESRFFLKPEIHHIHLKPFGGIGNS